MSRHAAEANTHKFSAAYVQMRLWCGAGYQLLQQTGGFRLKQPHNWRLKRPHLPHFHHNEPRLQL